MKGLRLVRLIAVLLAGLAVLLAVALVVLLSIDLAPYRRPLEARISAALGRPVRLNGPVRIHPSLWPTITVRDVAIDNPAWARQPTLAEVGRLSIQLEPWPLVQGQVRIARVVLVQGKLHLETDAEGATNWMLDRPPRAEAEAVAADALTRLPQIEVRRSHVDFREGRSGVVTRIEIIQALLSAEEGLPLELAFDGRLREHPLTVALVGGPLADLVRGDAPWPVRIAMVTGQARLTARGTLHRLPQPRFDLQLHAAGQEFDDLGGLIGAHLPPLGPFELDAQLVRDAAGYEVNGARGFLGRDEATRRFTVEEGRLAAPIDGPLELRVAGTFGKRPFALRLDGAPYPGLLAGTGDWPLRFSLQLRRTRLTAQGSLQPARGDFRLQLQAEGQELRTLEPVVGRALPALGPYRLQGDLTRAGNVLGIELAEGRIGGSDLRGSLEATLGEARHSLRGRLDSDRLDLDDFQPPRSAGGADGKPATGKPAFKTLPLPVGYLQALDGEVRVSVGSLLGTGERVEELRATLRLQPGRLEADVQRLRLGGEPITGRIAFDATGAVPAVTLDAHGRGIRHGPVLAALRVTERLDGHVERLDFSLRGRGRSLEEIWASAALRLEAQRGTLTVTRRGDDAAFSFWIEDGWATTSPEQGLQMALGGSLRGASYTLRLRGDGIRELADDTRPWHVQADGTLAGARIEIDGSMRAVFHAEGVDLRTVVQGERLSDLAEVLGRDLPPAGPYRFAGRLGDTQRGMRVRNLEGRLGQSDVTGTVEILPGKVPRLVASLSSQTLRLADLRGAEPATPPPATGRVLPNFAFPIEGLRRQDLDLQYDAARVTIGETDLRRLNVSAQLRGGRLEVSRVTFDLWQGTHTAVASLDVTQEPPFASVVMAIEDLNYRQVLDPARKAEPADGTAELALDLRGRGTDLQQTLATAAGGVEFYVDSGQIESRYLQLWAPNLMLSLLPGLSERQLSQIKCGVGRFDVSGGKAETRTLLLDLNRIVIKGSGSVDLKDESLDLLLWPEPRDRALIRLATPVRVAGALSQPDVRPQGQGVASDAVWLWFNAVNPVILAVNWLTPEQRRDNPCIGALAGPVADGEQENKPPGPLSQARDLLNRLGNLFKGNPERK